MIKTPDVTQNEIGQLYQAILPELWPAARGLAGQHTMPPGLLTDQDLELDTMVREEGGVPTKSIGRFWQRLADRWPKEISGDALRKRYERIQKDKIPSLTST